jgi:hypothetical protein
MSVGLTILRIRPDDHDRHDQGLLVAFTTRPNANVRRLEGGGSAVRLKGASAAEATRLVRALPEEVCELLGDVRGYVQGREGSILPDQRDPHDVLLRVLRVLVYVNVQPGLQLVTHGESDGSPR